MVEIRGREYARRLTIAMVVYAVVLIGMIFAMDHGIAQPWKTIVALVPVLPILYIAWLVIARFRTLDEYWQRIQLIAMPFAFLGSMMVAFTWGFLEIAGVERLNGFWMFGIMNGLWMLSLFFSIRRYT